MEVLDAYCSDAAGVNAARKAYEPATSALRLRDTERALESFVTMLLAPPTAKTAEPSLN